IAYLATPKAVEAGTEIVREGETGNDFFVLMMGTATVTRHGHEVGRLEPGNFFGELALFDPAPRNATISADVPVTMAVMERNRFQAALDSVPALRDALLKGMARRLPEVGARVWGSANAASPPGTVWKSPVFPLCLDARGPSRPYATGWRRRPSGSSCSSPAASRAVRPAPPCRSIWPGSSTSGRAKRRGRAAAAEQRDRGGERPSKKGLSAERFGVHVEVLHVAAGPRRARARGEA